MCSHLFLLGLLKVLPLLCYVAEVHLVHEHLHVSNGVVFGEAVEVVDRQHQNLPTQLGVRNLIWTQRRDREACVPASKPIEPVK